MQLKVRLFLTLLPSLQVSMMLKPHQIIVFSNFPSETYIIDGSSNLRGTSASLVLKSLKVHKIHCALRFKFKALNNKAKYEALIAGLRLAKELKVNSIDMYSDS